MSTIETRLQELGIRLPEPSAAVANYVPFVIADRLVSISGQLPFDDQGILPVGKLGADVSLDDGVAAARRCGINLIAQLKAAAGGDLDRIAQIVKLGGFVQSADTFFEQPKVINGASDLMVEVFGDKGRHSRSAVGVNALPLGVPVEIDCLALLTA